MYHGNPPNRRQLAAEAEAKLNRERRERIAERDAIRDRQRDIERCQGRDDKRVAPNYAAAKRDDFYARLGDQLDSLEAEARGVVERVGDYTSTYSAQQIGQCHRIAQILADHVAAMPVDLSLPPVSPPDFGAFMRTREQWSMVDRVRQVYTLGLIAPLAEADLDRLETADLALVQTVEAAVYAGMELIEGRRSRTRTTWQNEPRRDPEPEIDPNPSRGVNLTGAVVPEPEPAPRRDAAWGVR